MERFLMWIIFIIPLIYCGVNGDNSDVVKSLTLNVGFKASECLGKFGYSQGVLDDLLHYWDKGHRLSTRESGCVLDCAFQKLHLIKSNGEVDQAYVGGFVKASGGDTKMIKILADLYTACLKRADSNDPCERTLQTNNCFAGSVQESSWVPIMHAAVDNFRRCAGDEMDTDQMDQRAVFRY